MSPDTMFLGPLLVVAMLVSAAWSFFVFCFLWGIYRQARASRETLERIERALAPPRSAVAR